MFSINLFLHHIGYFEWKSLPLSKELKIVFLLKLGNFFSFCCPQNVGLLMASPNWSVPLTINSFQTVFLFNFLQNHKICQRPGFLLDPWNSNSSWQTESQDNRCWNWPLEATWSNALLKERPAKISCSTCHPSDFLIYQDEISQPMWDSAPILEHLHTEKVLPRSRS